MPTIAKNLRLVGLAAAAVLVTFFVHELAHWAVGTGLGNEMRMTLNSASPVSGSYREAWHAFPVTLAGPAVTIVQALAVFWLMRRGRHRALYPFLVTPFVMRALAAAMNVIHPNDEGRISQSLGLGLYSLPILVSALLAWLVYRTSRRHGLTAASSGLHTALIVALCSILILANQLLA